VKGVCKHAAKLAALLLIGMAAAGGGSLRAGDPVVEGREALDEWPAYPWYDAEADDVARMPLPPVKQAPAPQSQSGSPSWSGEGLSVFVWLAIIVVLALVAYLLANAFLNRSGEAQFADEVADDSLGRQIDRVDALPVAVRRRDVNFLDEARRLYQLGDLNEAIVYLYSYLLIELDAQQIIHLTKGKTNRQYLAEASRRGELRAILQRTMLAFEDVFFGELDLDRADFDACWNNLDRFHHLLGMQPA
jgi:hypothetical protein